MKSKYEVLWYEKVEEYVDDLKPSFVVEYSHTKEFSSKKSALNFYEKIKKDKNLYGFWVTKRDVETWEVLENIIS